MIPKLFAFDLDGTLLNSHKHIGAANVRALREMRESGAVIALASGRLGATIRRYVPDLGFDTAIVALNGAEVFTSSHKDAERIYYAPLYPKHAEYLTDYGVNKNMAVNFYYDDAVYSVKSDANAKWTDLYSLETGVHCIFMDNFATMKGVAPSKIIFVGDTRYIDEQEDFFRSTWADGSVYVCRTWDHYLEFMNPKATKGVGLKTLCEAMGIKLEDTAAYGDADNDTPMLSIVGMGVAMKNAAEKVKFAAARVTELTANEDWLPIEWESIKKNRV